MQNTTKYYILLAFTVAAYFVPSKYIFDKVYETAHVVIDEYFHLPQGLAYCHRNLTYWDPKITTLPGLYLISAAVLGSYFECNSYNLRFLNLIASAVNLVLLSSILKFIYGNTPFKTVLQALNLALLPPLYFFSHVYYTDTLSVTFLLAFSRLCLENKYKLGILFCGLVSVLMRQTNIVWIALVFGHKTLDIMIRSSRVFGNNYLARATVGRKSVIAQDIDKSKVKRYYNFRDAFIAIRYHVTTCFGTFFKFVTFQDGIILLTHCIILILFPAFVYINGSIVVGDKKAHIASLHVPQMFYFLIFYGIFALPYVLYTLKTTLNLMFNNKLIVIVLAAIFTAIVHFNTVVHPYLLADNRHYTFYVWNRWFGKYDFAIYATVPLYVFLFFSLYANLKDQNCISFLLPYSICLFLVLSLQKLIDIRYFLIPYIILRLRFVRATMLIVALEFLWYVFLNAVTFNLFFTKEIMWKNFDYAQRIIW